MLPGYAAQTLMRDREAKLRAAASAKRQMNGLMSDDFATPDDVRAQLAELAEYLAERRKAQPDYALPQPLGWRIQVLMLTIPETSGGGVHMVDDDREARAMASPQGIILAMGEGAYSDPARFTVQGELRPWARVGDRVQFVKYDAQPFQLPNRQKLGILTDTQLVARIDAGWEVPA